MGTERKLFLFDVDGTLCLSQRKVWDGFLDSFKRLRAQGHHIGLVSGSDAAKVLAQFECSTTEELLQKASLQFVFYENGSMAYQRGEATTGVETISEQSFLQFLGEDRYQELINRILRLFSEVTLPKKRGRMIELRTGTLNVSPIGRSCTIEEREEFFLLDKQQGIRRRLLEDLRRDFGERFGLSFALGGQISIDIYPTGWDKGLVLTVLGDRFNEYKESFFAGNREWTSPLSVVRLR